MKIGVTSENKLKIGAVIEAYNSIGIFPEVIGYAANSGVGEQPINETTLVGARNRISDVRSRISDLDRIISIESGLFEEEGKWVDRAVIVIYNLEKNQEFINYSDGVIFPSQYVEEARKIGFDKITVGKVMESAGFVKDNKDPHLSISSKSRKEYIQQTVAKLVRQIERKE